ncbi:sigma-70 family RNA polymerase sigma factor [Nocardioides sp.]|uniref:sigma-70 family RNA polymerase sigma factor n=1 Tax=Nocardioides sp. TaxID=35761 RepID=UPI003529679B
MTAAGGASDAQLVICVLDGDREAFAEVYERYSDRLFDFAVGMLRNREDAADAVADSFVTMAERLEQLRDPSRLRPWLYAVVRRECLRRLKARQRVAFGDDDQLAAVPDQGAGPDEQAESAAMRELVWAAAEGLNERDRAVLDLHLRHGLEGQELADAMEISAGNAYTSLNRLKGQLERALGALLVARQGSADCAALADVLQGWDGTFSVLMRKRVARHIDQCLVCDERRVALAPLSLVAGVPILLAPSSLRDRVLGDSRLVSFLTDEPPAEQQPAAQPRDAHIETPVDPVPTEAGAAPVVAADRRRRLAGWLSLVAALLAIATLVGASLLQREPTEVAQLDAGLGESPSAQAAPPVDPSLLPSPDPLTPGPTTAPPTPVQPPPTTVAPPTSAPPSSAPPAPAGFIAVTPSLLDLGDVARAGDVTLTNTGTVPVDYTITPGAAWVLPRAGGSLAPKESTVVSIFIDRNALQVGTSETTVTVAWATGASSFTVRATKVAPSNGPSIAVP